MAFTDVYPIPRTFLALRDVPAASRCSFPWKTHLRGLDSLRIKVEKISLEVRGYNIWVI